MLTPEIQAYIAEQKAAGFSPEIIHDALLTAGWPEKDIAEALGIAPIVPKAVPTTFDTPNPKKPVWPIVLIAVIILLLAGGGYYVYAKPGTVTTNTGAPVVTPTSTSMTAGTNTLGSFTYSYPTSWSAQNIANGTYLTDSAASPSPSASSSATPNQLNQIAAASSSSNIIITGNPYPLSTGSTTPDVQAQGIATQLDASATTSTSIDGFSGYSVINRSTGSAMCEFILEGSANYFTVSFPLIQTCDEVPALYHQIVKNISESVSSPSPSPSAS